MNKVIFTADDFGVIPSVNQGIIDLVNRGIINSVEVFTNYHKSIENVELLLNQTNEANFELGTHLTITSGRPVTSGSGLDAIVEDGNFKPFDKTNSRAADSAIYKEIRAQIERLMDVPELQSRLTHLTCHHDALWFFPSYTEQLIKVANEFNFPIRNPKSFPKKRDKLYYTVVLPLLKTFSFTNEDVKLLKDTYDLRKKDLFPNKNLNFKAPHYMDSRHYGPLPSKSISPNDKAAWIVKKHDAMGKMLRKAVKAGGKREDKIIEFMFHFRKGDLSGGRKGFQQEMETLDYAGVNPNYFDSRTIEFEAVRFYEDKIKALIGEGFELGSWTQTTVQTLKKKEVSWF